MSCGDFRGRLFSLLVVLFANVTLWVAAAVVLQLLEGGYEATFKCGKWRQNDLDMDGLNFLGLLNKKTYLKHGEKIKKNYMYVAVPGGLNIALSRSNHV